MARKILLADDSVTAQNMGRKILTDAGYEVVTVNNGSAALKKIAEGKPDLIVLDVYMPGYSGLEVCQRIKENAQTARIPILLTVGKLEPFKPEEARRARADAFVVKPFEASELLSALTKLEDKIIPQAEPYKQGRFAKAVASVDQEPDGEKFGDSDEGWKARLRIPTGKPKAKDAEPDVDYAATQGKGFRNFVEPPPVRKGATPAATAGKAEFERPVPTGLPHDITPEEIAAITAAAAQLSGASAAAPAMQEPVAETTSPEIEAVPSEVSADENGPVTFASSPAFAEESESVPVAETVPSETAVYQVSEAEVAQGPAEITAAETAAAEAARAPVGEVEPASGVQAHQPAAIVEESAVVAEAEAEPASMAEMPVVASFENAPETGDIATIDSVVPQLADAPTVAAPPENTAQESPVAAAAPDDEVMAALQTLIPSASAQDTYTPADSSASEPSSSAFAAVAASATASRAHASGPRWIAEEVALAAEDATPSLEKEMQEAYAAFAAQGVAHRVTSSQETTSTVNEPVAETAPVNVPESIEPSPAYAMASAAAAGEGSPTVAAVSMQAAEISATVHSEERSAVPESEITGGMAEAPIAEVTNAPDIVGGDIMAANWKNIRDSIAGAAAKPAPVKEEFREPEPVRSEADSTPAVPTNESAPSHLSASDPKAIASIVDSVLSELRPKIVEEIARKLADSKKD